MQAVRAAVILAGCIGAPVLAQDNPVVVELFTSQGCSSCPPADALLQDLAQRDGVIALALHVDYWDYIGWEDSFASPAFTERQHLYARAAGERMVYTPQFIIGGVDRSVGADTMALMDLIAGHADRPAPVMLEVRASESGFSLEAESVEPGAMVVQLVRYDPEETVEILSGENRGRTLTYSNVVRDWDVIARWDGLAPLRLSAEFDGGLPAVVIVQEDGHGAILAAARVD